MTTTLSSRSPSLLPFDASKRVLGLLVLLTLLLLRPKFLICFIYVDMRLEEGGE